MSGINRFTGEPITGWEEVVQSVHTIFTTPLEMRIERRWVGSRVPFMLGKNLTKDTILNVFAAMAEGLDLFEPRFKLTKIDVADDVGGLRKGQISFLLNGVYRPNAHLGDMTPDYLMSKRQIEVYASTNGLQVG
jgi:uncharacterized protein